MQPDLLHLAITVLAWIGVIASLLMLTILGFGATLIVLAVIEYKKDINRHPYPERRS